MTDFTREWIAKREELEQAATEGPWEAVASYVDRVDDAASVAMCVRGNGIADDPDAEFIADARTSLPAAMAALKAVLERGGPRATGNYSEYSDGYHDALDACWDTIEATLRRKS